MYIYIELYLDTHWITYIYIYIPSGNQTWQLSFSPSLRDFPISQQNIEKKQSLTMVNFRLWLTWWFQIVQPKFSQRVWVITIQKTLRLTTPAGFSATLQWTFIPFHLFTCINLAGLTVEYDDNRFKRCLVFLPMFLHITSCHPPPSQWKRCPAAATSQPKRSQWTRCPAIPKFQQLAPGRCGGSFGRCGG